MSIDKKKKSKLPQKDELTPGGIKTVNAFISLLKKKEFDKITTAEIAKVSGVNESLIYKYFGSKRELLHTVLFYYTNDFVNNILLKLKDKKSSLDKLRVIIWEHINLFQNDLVFAKILLLEVRNYPGYYHSKTYGVIKKYTMITKEIIEDGKKNNEIRKDLSSWVIMQIIMGGIEHLCMPALLFKKYRPVDDLTNEFCEILFKGIRKGRSS